MFQEESSISGKPVRLSPDRDLAVMWPMYVLSALRFSDGAVAAMPKEEQARMEAQMNEIAKRMIAFQRGCVGPTSPKTVHEICERVGLFKDNREGLDLLGHYLLRVLVGAYFSGVRMALMRGEKPLELVDLMARACVWEEKKETECQSTMPWSKRIWKRFFPTSQKLSVNT
jgi:hypothetical protein